MVGHGAKVLAIIIWRITGWQITDRITFQALIFEFIEILTPNLNSPLFCEYRKGSFHIFFIRIYSIVNSANGTAQKFQDDHTGILKLNKSLVMKIARGGHTDSTSPDKPIQQINKMAELGTIMSLHPDLLFPSMNFYNNPHCDSKSNLAGHCRFCPAFPSSINFFTASTGGLKRFCFTINNRLFERSAALIIAEQSGTVKAIGFSQSTCRPVFQSGYALFRMKTIGARHLYHYLYFPRAAWPRFFPMRTSNDLTPYLSPRDLGSSSIYVTHRNQFAQCMNMFRVTLRNPATPNYSKFNFRQHILIATISFL